MANSKHIPSGLNIFVPNINLIRQVPEQQIYKGHLKTLRCQKIISVQQIDILRQQYILHRFSYSISSFKNFLKEHFITKSFVLAMIYCLN